MKRLLLNACVAFIGLSVYAQQSTTQVVAPPSNVDLQDPRSITLKPGFWAKPGSVFRAHIGYRELNINCPIVTKSDFRIAYVSPNTYRPEAINNSLRLALSYDTAGNTSRIYFANAGTSTGSGKSPKFSKEVIASLIYIYPNPTRGKITVSWDHSVDNLIASASLVMPNGVTIPLRISAVNGKREGSLNFRGTTGMYFLHVTLTDGRVVPKTLLKQ